MTRMLSRLFVVFAMVLAITLSVIAPASAQSDDGEELDVAAIGETVIEVDPEDLLTGLEEPIDSSDLPKAFTEAEFVDPDEAGNDQGLFTEGDLEGTIGTVSYSVAGDEDELGGAGVATIQYVAFDADEVTGTELEDFVGGAEGALDELTDDIDASVETVEIAGVDAAVISLNVVSDEDAAYSYYVAIPVGNVFVFTQVTVEGDAELDEDAVYEAAEALTISAVAHLGEVADAA